MSEGGFDLDGLLVFREEMMKKRIPVLSVLLLVLLSFGSVHCGGPTICKRGIRKCQGTSKVVICNATQSAFVPFGVCEAARFCEKGRCTGLYVCQPNEVRCSGNRLLVCAPDRKQFIEKETCIKNTRCSTTARACERVKICSPGSLRCQGEQPQRCSKDGGEYEKLPSCGKSKTCLAGKCVSRSSCTPNEKKCDGSDILRCKSDGSEYILEPCPSGMKCESGTCTKIGICKPGESKCDGTFVSVCKADGSGFERRACSGGYVCYQGRCATCVPHKKRCVQNRLMVCNATGSSLIPLQDCSGKCEKERCVVDPKKGWVTPVKGVGGYTAMDIAVDQDGNAIVTGTFKGSIVLGTFKTTNILGQDFFVAKFDKQGTFIWRKHFSRTLEKDKEHAHVSVKIIGKGHFILGGMFSKTLQVESTSMTSNGQDDMFVARFSEHGSLVWAQNFGGKGADVVRAIEVHPQSIVYLAGGFSEIVSFGSTSATSKGKKDYFIASLDSSGKWSSVITGGSTEEDEVTGLHITRQGELYVVGTFAKTVAFGNFSLTAFGSLGAFVGKFNTRGQFLFARTHSGNGQLFPAAMTSDPSGNVFMAGKCQGGVTLGTLQLSCGSEKGFVARFDKSGRFLWGKAYTDPHITSIVSDNKDSIYIPQGPVARISFLGVYRDIQKCSCKTRAMRFAGGALYTMGSFTQTSSFEAFQQKHSLTAQGSEDIFVWNIWIP